MKRKAKVKTAILLISLLGISFIAGCVGNNSPAVNPIGNPGGSPIGNPLGNPSSSWCNAGQKTTQKGPTGEMSYTVKGITTYKGKTVCEMDYATEQGSMVFYTSEDGKYYANVILDKNGKIISEGESSNP